MSFSAVTSACRSGSGRSFTPPGQSTLKVLASVGENNSPDSIALVHFVIANHPENRFADARYFENLIQLAQGMRFFSGKSTPYFRLPASYVSLFPYQ